MANRIAVLQCNVGAGAMSAEGQLSDAGPGARGSRRDGPASETLHKTGTAWPISALALSRY